MPINTKWLSVTLASPKPITSSPKLELWFCIPPLKNRALFHLLPRVHLAIVRPEMLRADMHQVFAEAKDSHYLVFITGPSRTADIELTVTLGVHGPKNLYVWMMRPVDIEFYESPSVRLSFEVTYENRKG